MTNQTPSGASTDDLSEEDVDRIFRQGDSLFCQLFDSSTIGMTVASTDARFLRVNPTFERFIGYSSAELLQLSLLDITHPDDIALSEEIRDNIPDGVQPVPVIEKRYITKDGITKWGSVTRTQVKDEETGTRLIVAQIQDVTDLVIFQSAQEATDKRLESYLNIAADRYWETDRQHRFVYLSAPTQEFPRLATGELLGRTRWEIENSSVNPPWDAYQAIMESHEPFNDYEYHRIRPDGSESNIRTSGEPIFDNEGNFEGYRGINREITKELGAYQLAENKFQLAQQRMFDAMEHLEAGIILWSKDLEFVYCNSYFRELQPELGPLLVPGAIFAEVAAQFDMLRLEGLEDAISRSVHREQAETRDSLNGVFDYSIADGRWIRARRQRLSDGSIISFHTDVTEQKRAVNLKDEFVSLISHELRTPLTSVMGAVGLVIEGITGKISDETAEMLKIAYRNCETLNRHVNDILDLSKIEAGEMLFNMEVVDVRGLIEKTVELNSIFAEQLECYYEVADGPDDVRIFGDPDRISQTLTNLLSNAAKHSPQHGGVTLSVERIDGHVRISVTDRGDGIPHRMRDKIFDRFTQAEETNNRKFGGTGLGLSIAKEIIHHHGGRINFTTQINSGTTFFFELPEYVEGRADLHQ